MNRLKITGKRLQILKKCFPTAFLFVLLSSTQTAQAICPICTVAVGAGVGFSRYLGVDDAVTGTWIGALTVSIVLWTLNWMAGKNIKFKGEKAAIYVGYYALIVLPLYFSGMIGHPMNTLWGIDKLLLGIIFGSLFFLLGAEFHFYSKEKNGGKVYFPFQKVVFSISPVVVLSAAFYFITK